MIVYGCPIRKGQSAGVPPETSDNEPDWLFSIFDTNFSGFPTSDGWEKSGNAIAYSDATAPVSPTDQVARLTYSLDFPPGSSPGALYYQTIDKTWIHGEYYVRSYFRFSAGWTNQATGTKLWYPQSSVASPFFLFAGADSKLWCYVQNTVDGDRNPGDGGVYNLAPNVNTSSSVVTLGDWHKFEHYFKPSSASGVADGIIRWWLDGVLIGDYTDIKWIDSEFVWEVWRWEPVWGGTGGPNVDHEQYLDIDGTYISVRYPHKPGSYYTTIFDEDFDAFPTSGTGWQSNSGTLTVVTDATAPLSPGDHVARWEYDGNPPSGPGDPPNDNSPGTLYATTQGNTYNEYYVAFYYKVSANWDSNVGRKIWYPYEANADIFMIHCGSDGANAYGGAATPGSICMGFQPGPTSSGVSRPAGVADDDSYNLKGNVNQTVLSKNVWHLIEFHFVPRTSTNCTVRWWVDGLIQGDYTTLVDWVTTTPTWEEWRFVPTWAAGSGTANDQFMYVDHCYLVAP